MDNKVFLIDANSLITPYESYYPFDLFPVFWEQMELYIKNEKIAILDVIKDEFEKGDDDLSKWIKTIEIPLYIDRRTKDVIEQYSEILSYIQNSKDYKDSALMEWSKATVADPWLIAVAKIYGYEIITFEKYVPINPGQPAKMAKIPNIAEKFGVSTSNLFNMLRVLGFNSKK